MKATVRRIQQRFPDESGRVIHDELEQVELPETQRRVPVKYGDLKSTGRVTEPETRGNTTSCSIAYGGESTNGKDVDYALYVHENLEAEHPIGEAKYVSGPLNESAPHLSNRFARRWRMDNLVK
jgi:hypothetical protein